MSTLEVSRCLNVSLRQLQWWDEIGVAFASKVNGDRDYDKRAVFSVALVASLRRRGFSLQTIRRLLLGTRAKVAVNSAFSSARGFLVVSRMHVSFEPTAETLVNLVTALRVQSCVIAVESLQ